MWTDPPAGIKPRGVIHWVAAHDAIPCEVKLYERLFTEADPEAGGADFLSVINPQSLVILRGCIAEASLGKAQVGQAHQFEREGYFCLDKPGEGDTLPIFNRTIALRDSWTNE